MPKNNPKDPIRPTPRNPQNPPGHGGGSGGGGTPDFPPSETILLSLVKLNEAVLPNLQLNEKVVFSESSAVVKVSTALGTLIGNVSSEDVARLEGRRLKGGRVFQVQLKPKQCVIEAML